MIRLPPWLRRGPSVARKIFVDFSVVILLALVVILGLSLQLWRASVRVSQLSAVVDEQARLVAGQKAAISTQTGLISQQRVLVEAQDRNVGAQKAALGAQRQALEHVRLVAEVERKVGAISHWLIDLCVTQLSESQENSEKEKQLLLTLIARLEAVDAQSAATLRPTLEDYWRAMMLAVDSYTEGNTVLGNARLSEARLVAIKLSDRLGATINSAQGIVEESRRSVDEAGTEVERAGDKVKQVGVELGRSGEELAAAADKVFAATGQIRGATQEVQRGADLALELMFVALGVLVAIGGYFASRLSRGITARIHELMEVLEALGRGNLDRSVKVRSADELGRMAAALNRSIANTSIAMGKVQQASARDRERSQELHRRVHEIQKVLNAASERLNTIAAGTEEMEASIQEISRSATEAASVGQGAVESAERTNASVSQLGDSSSEIGNVVEVIRSIAKQTNLLALNATIEAARAGEAGRGFAVVAGEVKDLASQTDKATSEIAQKIQAIQSDSQGAVGSIGGIAKVIAHINELQTGIAGAVEEQSCTTREIGRYLQETAKAAAEITQSLAEVVRSTEVETA